MLYDFEKAHIIRAQTSTPEHLENRWLWKLGRAAQAAIDRVEHVPDLHGDRIELVQPDRHLACRPRLVGKPRQQRGTVLLDTSRLLAKKPSHLAQNVDEGRTPETGLLWKIGAAPDRLGLGRQEHGQRPAALFTK